jgi:Fe-S-cluster containining protein
MQEPKNVIENKYKDKLLPLCCLGFDSDLYQYDLIFPERMSPDWREFIETHGIYNEKLGDLIKGAKDLGGGKVSISHRCPKLGENGRCTIYENRPKICRNYVCKFPQCKFKDLCEKSAREEQNRIQDPL